MQSSVFIAVALLASLLAADGRSDQFTGDPAADASPPALTAPGTADEPTPAEPEATTVTIPPQTPAPTLATDAPADRGDEPRGSGGTASDAGVVDASAERPAPPQATERPRVKPSELIRALVKSDPQQSLAGMPLTLADVLEGAETRRDQTDRALAYWKLFQATANYSLTVQETAEIATLRQGVALPGKEWDGAQQELAAQARTAKQEVATAQQRLQQLMGGNPGLPLVLPADLPHCGRYETRYAEIFADKPVVAAAEMSRLLALRFRQLSDQADAVAKTNDWLFRVSAGRLPNSDGTDLLRAHELWSLQRRAFIATACSYNQEIVEYSALAAPGKVGAQRLVAMLIRNSKSALVTSSTDRRDPNVTPAAAFEPEPATPPPSLADQPGDQDAREGFFASRRREARRPLLRNLFEREHSILKPPRRRLFE